MSRFVALLSLIFLIVFIIGGNWTNSSSIVEAIDRLRIPAQATEPETASVAGAGALWLETDVDPPELCYSDGSIWVPVDGAGLGDCDGT